MPHPSLQDDGDAVTLDLHGASVAEAVHLADSLMQVASARGRRSVRFIHGSSTTPAAGGAQTIKAALHDRVDGSRWQRVAVSHWKGEDVLLLSLSPGSVDRRAIRMFDL